jgi:hypothetical protein
MGARAEEPAREREESRAPLPLVEEAERVAASISGKLATPEAESRAEAGGQSHAAPPADAGARHAAIDPPAPAAKAAGEAAGAFEGRAGGAQGRGQIQGRVRQHASAVGSRAGETLRPRVEKLREASVVVLDEAAEDPGLRFLIVAALLFVVFLILWLLSYILG